MKLICWVVKVNLIFVCFMLHWVEGCLCVCVRFSVSLCMHTGVCVAVSRMYCISNCSRRRRLALDPDGPVGCGVNTH